MAGLFKFGKTIINSEAVKTFSVKESVKAYKLKALKSLSQNFILDDNICDKLIKQSGDLENSYVCEVGPGPGGLTKSILKAGAKHLAVIEKDERFFPTLEVLNESYGGKMKLYHGDVLRFNMHDIFPKDIAMNWDDASPKAQLIGNLPFAVSTPLIIRWLREISLKEGVWRNGRVPMTLTFQKEVAERMVAKTRADDRCRLSIMCQSWCHVIHKFTINGKAFVPAPKVDVGVVRLIPRVTPQIDSPFEYVEKLVRHVFHYRNKDCKHSLRTLFPPDRLDLTKRLLDDSDVHSDTKPCFLEVRDFGRLCRVYKEICDEDPDLFTYDFRSQDNAMAWRADRTKVKF